MVIQNDHIAGTIATLQHVLRRSKNKIIKQTPTWMVRLYEVGENDTHTHTCKKKEGFNLLHIALQRETVPTEGTLGKTNT